MESSEAARTGFDWLEDAVNRLKLLAIIIAALALGFALHAPVSAAAESGADTLSPPPETESFRLWEGRAPGATGDDAAQTPTLRVVRPPDGWANGTAIIIAPGGAYANLALAQEGSEPASWFAARGVTAFILTYRVGKVGRLPGSRRGVETREQRREVVGRNSRQRGEQLVGVVARQQLHPGGV